MVRNLLTIVGLAYLVLAVWCAVSPVKTSQSVGFDLQPGSGQSEYFVIYGGLQLALGLVFLLPLIKPDVTVFALMACVLIHGCIVLFRSLSFLLYTGIQPVTYILSVVEWLIFIASAIVAWKST